MEEDGKHDYVVNFGSRNDKYTQKYSTGMGEMVGNAAGPINCADPSFNDTAAAMYSRHSTDLNASNGTNGTPYMQLTVVYGGKCHLAM